MARMVIQRMGGQISCVSVRGLGTKFKVFAPLKRAQHAAPALSFASCLAPSARIAVVTDHPALSASIIRWARSWGSGRVLELSADEAFADPHPGCVIIEQHVLSGFELRRRQGFAATCPKRLVVLGRPANRQALNPAWRDMGFVTKPVKQEALMSALLEQLSKLEIGRAHV